MHILFLLLQTPEFVLEAQHEVPCPADYGGNALPCEERSYQEVGGIRYRADTNSASTHALLAPDRHRWTWTYTHDPNDDDCENPLFYEAGRLWRGEVVIEDSRIQSLRSLRANSQRIARRMMEGVPEDERCTLDYFELMTSMELDLEMRCVWR